MYNNQGSLICAISDFDLHVLNNHTIKPYNSTSIYLIYFMKRINIQILQQPIELYNKKNKKHESLICYISHGQKPN